ncbi:unnamed protein product [Cuscuta europaea]|uniref:Uncharacterized protein n=1 Tax=Cuscuta europaea TaxID=41803 RepID=A0A9P0ZT86_CUSEU|nr:unnamed protein product [Cuscuta europaea]
MVTGPKLHIMEKRILNQYDMEYMKTSMLKHEETFKEQVYELHRLYQTQKKLMKNISKQKREYNNTRIPRESNLEEDESELELTLGPSRYSRCRKNKSQRSLSSSSSSSSPEDFKWGIELPAAMNQSFLGGGQNGQNGVEDLQFRINNQPWHFQALSLNMTS